MAFTWASYFTGARPGPMYILHTCLGTLWVPHRQNALAEDYERVNVIGTENVLRQADEQKMCQSVQQVVRLNLKDGNSTAKKWKTQWMLGFESRKPEKSSMLWFQIPCAVVV